MVDHPVEHATWAGNPSPGDYEVIVELYGWNDAPHQPVPFTVVVRDGGGDREYHGVIEMISSNVRVVSFTR